jgi:uncharacterized membrane protein (UPF0127 family)
LSRLWNPRTGAVLADSVERARTPWARMRGLLGRRELPQGGALCIEPCTSIHTFFMQFPIDAVFLRHDGLVLRAIPRMRPFRLTRFYPSAALAVELPAGTLQKTATREGDVLALDD